MERIRSHARGWLITLGLVVGSVACSSTDEPTPGPGDEARPAQILSFTGTPETIHEPRAITLEWEVRDAESIFLFANDEPVELGIEEEEAGSTQVSIEATTVFELVASGAVGEPARATQTIEYVDLRTEPSIASFSAPTEVVADPAGDAIVELSWTGVLGADELTLEMDSRDPQLVPLDQTPDGGMEVTIREDTVFVLVATNELGEARMEAEVRVVHLPHPSIATFSAPEEVVAEPAGDAVVSLSWTGVAEALQLTLEADTLEPRVLDLEQTPDGGVEVTIRADTIFTLVATNEMGEARMETEVRVVHLPRPSIATFSAPAEVFADPAGDATVRLSWTGVLDALQLSLEAGEQPPLELDLGQTPDGSVEVALREDTRFTLVATNEMGEARMETAVRVVAPPPPSIASFTGPEVVGVNLVGDARARLAWTGVVGALELSLQVGAQQPLSLGPEQMPDGSLEVTIREDTRFVLTASNVAGESSEQLEVQVAEIPIIDALAVDRPHVGSGEEVELSWETSQSTEVALYVNGSREEGLAGWLTKGSYTLPILTSSTLELRALNEVGAAASESIEITVGAPYFTSSVAPPATLWLGESATLSWTGRGASSAAVFAGDPPQELCSSSSFRDAEGMDCEWSPLAAGAQPITIELENASGKDERSWIVQVGDGPRISSFTSSATQISDGGSVRLSWATLPDIDGEEPSLSLRDDRGRDYPLSPLDSITIIPSDGPGAYTFTLRAETSHPLSQPVEESVVVEVLPLPVISLQATPSVFDDSEHEEVVLSWTSSHAVSLVLYQLTEGPPIELAVIPEEERAAGSHAVIPVEDSTYRLVAANELSQEVHVDAEVSLAPLGILSFDARPREIVSGEPVELSWATRMAEEVSLDILDGAYLREDTDEPYLDTEALGGSHLPLVAECGGVDAHISGCALLEFPRGFTFPFGGIEHSTARVYYGGALSFDFLQRAISIANHQFPTGETATNYHIAAFWGSLAFDGSRYPSGNVYTLFREDEEEGDSLIIHWKDSGFNGFPSASINFQIVLWEDGTFEYRYGEMEAGLAPPEYARGSRFTIGYQSLGQEHFDNINYNTSIAVRGSLEHRSFRYTPSWALPTAGTLEWFPLATEDKAAVELTALRGTQTEREAIEITVHRRPTILITARPTEPLEVGTSFTIRWEGSYANRIELLDQAGAILCEATSPSAIEDGSCLLEEEAEAIYTYRLRATGAMGHQVEKSIEVVVYEPFGITSFQSDSDFLEIGDTVTLSWETFNAHEVSLVANDREYLPDGFPSGPGEIEVSDLPHGSTFTLRVRNSVGVSREESLFVELWKVRLDLIPSTTVARPGVPMTITVDAQSIEGGPAPIVRGTLPMRERTGSSWQFESIAGTEGAQELSTNSVIGYAQIDLPEGFSFPYFDRIHSGSFVGRMMVNGYIAFATNAVGIAANDPFPHSTSANTMKNIAPFWDALRRYSNASMWSKLVDPDTFVLEWSGMSFSLAGVNDGNQPDINFQVWLHRDGGFEFRYGDLQPLPTDLPPNRCFPHDNCANEVQGSSATIGYQDYDGSSGFTLHYGGRNNHIDNEPFPGGLAHRTFVYEPVVGRTTLTFIPDATSDYVFCTESGDTTVCKTLRITADFSLDSFEAESPKVPFLSSTWLNWTSTGATELTIHDDSGNLLYSTTDTGFLDEGAFRVTPLVNTTYTIEIRAGSYVATQDVTVEVARMELDLSAPAEVRPGESIPLSWTLVNADPGLTPVVISPMGEVFDAPFSEWDLTQEAEAQPLFDTPLVTGIAEVEFDPDFSFHYMGESMDRAFVSIEGYLSFDPAVISNGTNQRIPSANATWGRMHIAPFWDDLNTFASGQVLAMRVDADTYVIQWSHMSVQIGGSAENPYDLNFQVVLRRDGDFEFRYGTMQEPPAGSGACLPTSCWSEANGSSATIGYQHPDPLVGSMVHYATARGMANAVPGGLSNRTFKFHASATSGVTHVPAWNSGSYQICAFDPVTKDSVCSDEVEVAVPWGLTSFEASPGEVYKDAPVTLSWEVENLDELVITANGVEIERLLGAAIPASGSIEHNPSVNTTYELIGISVGREVRLQSEVEIRTFDLVLQGPQSPGFPGELVTLSWNATQLEPGEFHVLPPLFEIPAGEGQPGAYRDISGEEGAIQLTATNTTSGFADVSLSFPFPFFGTSYTALKVYNRGFISFDQAGVSGPSTNDALPMGGVYDSVHLAPFWDNLQQRGPDRLYAYEPDTSTLIIQWTHFNRAQGSSASAHYDLNFQVVLRADGSFEYRYGTMAPPTPPSHQTSCFPSSCEVEAQGGSATIAYQVPGRGVAYNHHVGGNYFESTFAPEGGLSGRAFGYAPSTSGSTQVRVGRNRSYQVCAFTETFTSCEEVWVGAVAEPGDLMITELMIDPTSGASGQWFEVRNLSDEPMDLEGFTIRNDRASHPISSALSVPPRGFVTLAASTDALQGADYVYGPLIELDEESDKLALLAGTATIAGVEWGASWSIPSGQTLGLDPSYQLRGVVSNDESARWCWEDGSGSPGAIGWGCTSQHYSVDPSSALPFYDISSSGTRLSDLEARNVIAEVPVTGFSMPYFNGSVQKVWASSNGWISFSEDRVPSGGTASPTVNQIPRSSNANPAGPLIAPFWTALQCTPTSWDCTFHYQQTELLEKDVLILQWSGYRPGGGAGELRFQVQLWEDGDVVVAFAEAASSDQRAATGFRYYWGEQAWIGMEGHDPLDFLTAFHRGQLDMSYRSFHFRRR